jgi:hypothetical protein
MRPSRLTSAPGSGSGGEPNRWRHRGRTAWPCNSPAISTRRSSFTTRWVLPLD